MQEEDSTAKKGVLRSRQGLLFSFFPTCQVRVVRFYQSCSPPPLPASSTISASVHFRLANSSPTSELSELPSSVSSAGPEPAPSELSEHRWTWTWDFPSSVSTAGPQRPDRMPEDMPDRMPEGMPATKRMDVMVGVTRIIFFLAARDMVGERFQFFEGFGISRFFFFFCSFSKHAKRSKGRKLSFFHQALFLPDCPFEKLIVNDYQGRRA